MAIIRRNKSKDALLRRAHLGNIDNADEILNLARQNGIKVAPLDVDSLMKLMGIEVNYSHDLDKDESGSLKKIEGDTWVCTVNANHHPTRQRFTLAHELAHYVLHRNKQNDFVDHTYFRNTDNDNPMEYEANAFAGALLMPELEIRSFIRNVSSNVDEISDNFGVSPLAVRVRARQLGFKEQS